MSIQEIKKRLFFFKSTFLGPYFGCHKVILALRDVQLFSEDINFMFKFPLLIYECSGTCIAAFFVSEMHVTVKQRS
jgi:hypothetical protein